MVKNSAQARRASKSRHDSESAPPPLIVLPTILNGVERPVTTAQLAAHLQVTTRTIANYREQRLIPYWRINSRNIRYRLSDVEKALAI
jgi:hypothetical protein